MIIRTQEHIVDDIMIPCSYQLLLSAQETKEWARKPNASWPCSQLAGHRLMVMVDQNGLSDVAVDGKYPDELNHSELAACVSDFLPDDCCHLWPVWN